MLGTCERGKLSIRLCKLMGWQKKDYWKVWCQVLSKDKLKQLIKRLERKD